MTLQKAIKILDLLIEQQTILAKAMTNPGKPWNQDFDCLKDMANTMSENLQHQTMALQAYWTVNVQQHA